jgi:hypothetical protein
MTANNSIKSKTSVTYALYRQNAQKNNLLQDKIDDIVFLATRLTRFREKLYQYQYLVCPVSYSVDDVHGPYMDLLETALKERVDIGLDSVQEGLIYLESLEKLFLDDIQKGCRHPSASVKNHIRFGASE